MVKELNLSKLPVWAQEHIGSLQRQRDEAVKRLAEFTDSQTVSNIFLEEYQSAGSIKHFIQSDRVKMKVGKNTFTLALEGETINIMCHVDSIHVQPSSGNVIRIWGARHRHQ